ncbi:thiamine diphosphokinase [Meiothermus granaticius]|uniref:Thiamine diphosphokinase n=1 Tax=Meiothermus granaticius NBRC 107808 TaxID=1227551 RepID=A0A399F6F1_9DEIN|nr:thiamine diphosphokinase [Meiothermus granaticius]RIH91670.1 Thiamine pyrophosphokinase [Meiothermus granaticius NBRC 107808]GEM86090.1 thiamine pyrophosphokinase [Meiothermus granaticius NBRC 107808]
MSRFTLLLGGGLSPTSRLRAQITGSRCIAADGGMIHAAPLGLVPELWVGDFDSAGEELLRTYPQVPRESHPRAKDQTDGELAVGAALRRGASALVLVGATGGQTDHALGNLLLSLNLAQEGIPTLLTTGLEEAYPLLPGHRVLDLPPGSRFSLIPLTDLEGVSIRGARWPLDEAQVPLGHTLTLSNQVIGDLEIGLRSGKGLILAYPYQPAT